VNFLFALEKNNLWFFWSFKYLQIKRKLYLNSLSFLLFLPDWYHNGILHVLREITPIKDVLHYNRECTKGVLYDDTHWALYNMFKVLGIRFRDILSCIFYIIWHNNIRWNIRNIYLLIGCWDSDMGEKHGWQYNVFKLYLTFFLTYYI
jgi:hypothetical protein